MTNNLSSKPFAAFRRLGVPVALQTLVALPLFVLLAGCAGDAGRFVGKDKRGKTSSSAKAAEADGAGNTESYAKIVENPFQRVSAQLLSTFSIDVDTASYSNVRRFLLQQGQMPPADAVRIEELINYFPYAYLPPKADHPVAFTLELGECPWNARHHLARIGLAARKISPDQMPPRNLVFLIDTSGSMNAPNRLPLLKSSLKLLVDQLTARDHVAIVAYAGSAGLVLPSTAGSDKTTIQQAIDRLHASGSTNGGEGITLAYRVTAENFVKGGVNRVVLGTDGDFNVGITDRNDLVRLIEEKRRSGVFLTILGFGMGNLKDATLEQLAHHGNGHYAYIDTESEARKVFVEQGAALVVVANKDPEAEKSQLLSQMLGGAVQTEMSADFRFAAAVASFGMLLRDSAYKGDATWAGTRRLAKGGLGGDPGGHHAGFLEMIDAAERLAGGK